LQLEDNQKLLFVHNEKFGRIRRGLVRSHISENEVNSKSVQICEVLEKDKDSVWKEQKKEFAEVEGELHDVIRQISEIEKTLQTTSTKANANFNVDMKITYDPPRRISSEIELALCVTLFLFSL
jgi:hypothetical protein